MFDLVSKSLAGLLAGARLVHRALPNGAQLLGGRLCQAWDQEVGCGPSALDLLGQPPRLASAT